MLTMPAVRLGEGCNGWFEVNEVEEGGKLHKLFPFVVGRTQDVNGILRWVLGC